MKTLNLLFICFLLITATGNAQNEQDCCGAHQLQAPTPFFIEQVVGTGSVSDPIESCSCSGQPEVNSYWFIFDCTSASSLEFIIEPLSGAPNYDFVLYQGGCPCSTSFTGSEVLEIACDSVAPLPTDPKEPAGMGDPTQWGYPSGSKQFVPAVALEEGATYTLVINNVTGEEGFSLQFGPDVQIGQLPKPGPDISGPTTHCPGELGIYTIDIGIGTPQFDTAYWFLDGNFIALTQTLFWWFPDPGTYELCVELEIDCNVSLDPSCITIDVVPLPTTFLYDNICSPPGGYIGPDGNNISSPGIYEYVFENSTGHCDSTVVLTLTGASPSFESRFQAICQGDCFDFEGEEVCETNLYEKIYTNQFGCDSTIILNLLAVPLEIEVDGLDTLTCKKTNITLNAGQTIYGGPTATFIWTNASGDTLSMDTLLNVSIAGEYTLTVTTEAFGLTCDDAKVILVEADLAPPEEVVAFGGTISCSVTSAQLLGSSSTPDVTYEWSGPSGFISQEQNPFVTQAGTYTLTVTAENGCTTQATAEVQEMILTLEANASGGTVNCYSSNVTLNGSSPAPGIVSYVWQGPGGPYFGPNPVVNNSGNYVLTVTDFNGCTGTATTSVTEDTTPPVASASSGQALNCNFTPILLSGFGSSTGTSFSYLWSTFNGHVVSGGNTLNPSVNAIGTYILTVTNNANGCTQTAQTEVFQTPPVTAAILSQTNVNCFGENNGTASALGGGGNGSFTYSWSNGLTGSDISGLSGGTYIVTVTDGEGCESTSSVTIAEPNVLSPNASASAQTMAGVNDGTASANPSGGTAGYTYLWDNGSTSQTIFGLAPGNYTVVVTDANGCQSTETVTVNELECLVTSSISDEDVSCNGAADGIATVSLTSATDPITFIWSNDETTATISNLSPGTYNVTATDANGCEVVSSATINEPAELNSNATSTDLTSPNGNDGTATASPTGGTNPYNFNWNNGGSTATITDLMPGDYTVTVMDANGCEAIQTVVVEQFDCGVQASIDFVNVSCNGGNNGSATALPTGGTAPFTYNWSNDESTETISNLSAGTYQVTITDANNCPTIAEVSIGEPTALTLEVSNQTAADCGSDNGSATVMADGGTPNYNYQWPGGETTTTVNSLAAGLYVVSVTDDNGCLTELEIEIETDANSDTEPPVAISQDLTIQLDGNGTASITATDIDDGSYDNCAIASLEIDLADFDCSHIGLNTEVTLTVTDAVGNTNTSTAVVTVEDDIAPTIDDCPADMVLPYCDPFATFSFTVDDNCPDDLTLIQTSGLASGSTFPTGETIQTFEATDAGDNTTACSFTITVPEDMELDTAVTNVNCFGENSGSIVTTVTGGSPDYTFSWSNDSTTMSLQNLEPGMYTLTLTDDAGCEIIQEMEITEPPQLITIPVNIINETGSMMNGSADVTVMGGVEPYTYEWRDLNGTVIGTTEDISGLSAGTYQLFVTDANGCVASSAYTIQSVNSTYNPDLDAQIKLFPNPTTGWLTLELIDLPVTEIEVTVFDVIGQSLFAQPKAKLVGGKYRMDLSQFPAGVYLVKLIIDGQTVTKRAVKVDD